MEKDDAAVINELYEYIQEASITTIADIKNLAKAKAKMPESLETFMDALCVFANALYALFTAGCPLFLQMKDIVRSLKKYTQRARAQMSKKTRASIMWIVTLQTRHFLRGEVTLLA